MTNSVTYKVLFAVGRFGAVIVNCNNIVKELVEKITGDRLDGLVDNFGNVPTEIGLYTGLLTVGYINPYSNSDEWEIGPITISGCMNLNKLEL